MLEEERIVDSWLGKGKAELERGEVGALVSKERRGEGDDMAEGGMWAMSTMAS